MSLNINQNLLDNWGGAIHVSQLVRLSWNLEQLETTFLMNYFVWENNIQQGFAANVYGR